MGAVAAMGSRELLSEQPSVDLEASVSSKHSATTLLSGIAKSSLSASIASTACRPRVASSTGVIPLTLLERQVCVRKQSGT